MERKAKRRIRVWLKTTRRDGTQIWQDRKGNVYNLRGMGAAMWGPKIGDSAFLSYQVGASYGLYFAERK